MDLKILLKPNKYKIILFIVLLPIIFIVSTFINTYSETGVEESELQIEGHVGAVLKSILPFPIITLISIIISYLISVAIIFLIEKLNINN